MQADYIIIGAGSAGCALANRLTEDPGTRVLLIEAGGRDTHPFIHIPAGYMKLLDHPTITWGFTAEADEGTAGRAIPYPRGRVLGGSSSINGLIYVRGQPEDFDHWVQLGNRGWGWDDVLPYFRKSEGWTGSPDDAHGASGPLTTSPGAETPELCRAAIKAAQQIGLEFRADLNRMTHGIGDNIGWAQQTRGGRFRASAARTYLRAATRRPNLRVVTGALVRRVVFEGTRAVAVEFSRGETGERAEAVREVILSAGAIGSPHLLQLSGVGDPEHLGSIGVGVVHALPGVGRNFQDHFLARVSARVQGAQSLNGKSRGLGLVGEVLRYTLTGRGILTYAASLLAMSVKVLEESETPDIQAQFAHGSFAAGPKRMLEREPGMTCGMWQGRPLSRGYVLARTSRAEDQPLINPRYMSEERDRRAVIGGLRFIRKLFAAPPLAQYVVAETVPGPQVQTDDELLDYARRTGGTVFHASCSCRMGQDPMAVVDDQLRVHGLRGIRVVDASVMPAVTTSNTNAPTIMIAERAADLIRAAARAQNP